MTRITATEAARNFSSLLNRVAAGEEIELMRNGAPVAVIGPPRARFVSAARLRDVLAAAPPVDDEFRGDLDGVRAEAGLPEDSWRS